MKFAFTIIVFLCMSSAVVSQDAPGSKPQVAQPADTYRPRCYRTASF